MNGTLIKFDDLQERESIDLIGGYIEIDMQISVFSGELSHIDWGYHYPKLLSWMNSMRWDPESSKWVGQTDVPRRIRFTNKSIEQFLGPYELETGEIFFIMGGKIAITIFPIGQAPPEKPQTQERYISLQKCFC